MKRIIYLLAFLVSLVVNAQNGQDLSCQTKHGLNESVRKGYNIFTAPANLRSDTLDILHTLISLDITDFTTQKIKGFATLRITPKVLSTQHVMLDLLKMNIDSIKVGNSTCIYQYNDTLMKVVLPLSFTNADTFDLSIYYNGVPQMDPSGWGGFYFSSGYAFNLGVGFDSKPHNYGRVWFPCFDNFAERCSFDFKITTSNGKLAYCNGSLLSDTTIAGMRTRHWSLLDPIPTYLASVSVANYAEVRKSYNGLNGTVPILLAALPADTTKIKNSFINLNGALSTFENGYGPYVWNRVGYCLVPFSSGAMEHATNISYPQLAANGALTYEDLMAHELSHHWWGDLLTCETAEEMWINEGWASFSAFLFFNGVYNYATYLQKVKASHQATLQHAHHKEGGFLALNNVPHQFTYGDHVYNKGADVAHTLRGYLGDSLFFSGLKYVMQQKQFTTMNSIEFRDLLTQSTGVNMNDFFDGWVLNGGWPHFSIDSFKVSGSSAPYSVTVYTRQRLFGAPNYFNNVPMDFVFMDANRVKVSQRAVLSGAGDTINFSVSVLPVYAGINFYSKISDAVNSEYKTLKSNSGTTVFGSANFNLQAQASGSDSSFIRVEHNLVPPDPIKNNVNSFRISKEHYWKVDGLLANGFNARGVFYFDGRKLTSGLTPYLDTSLTAFSSDSILLLYRRDAADDWKEYPYYTKFYTGGSLTKYGNCRADSLKLGEYTFANGVSTITGLADKTIHNEDFLVYPNPAKDELKVELKSLKVESLKVVSVSGQLVYKKLKPSKTETINCSQWNSGIYFIQVEDTEGNVHTEKVIIE